MKTLLITLIYGAAGIAVGWGGYLLQRLLAPKAPADSKDSQTPYECGEVPVGSAWQSWRWPFLPLATLLLLLEAEVIFALPWVWVQKTLSPLMALLELLLLSMPVGAAYAYLIRGGYLFPKSGSTRKDPALPAPYRDLQTYLLQPHRSPTERNSERQ